MLVLALESSTSSAKAILYDSETGVRNIASAPYPREVSSGGVSDTETVFRLTIEMGKRVAEGKEIAAIGLCGIWHSIALLDGSMNPVGKTYCWTYTEPGALCKKTREDRKLTDALYNNTGCYPNTTYMRHTLRYLKENGADLSGYKLLSQGAYNFFRLTGEYLETKNVTGGEGLLNLHTMGYDPLSLEYAGIREDQLPPLCDYTEVRPLNETFAKALGIKAGIPVVPAHADGALNQVANGSAVAGNMTLSVGTSGAIRLTTKCPVLPAEHQLWCYPGVVDYMSGAAINGACNCIDWFRNLVGLSFTELEEDTGSATTPVFLPFLFGERNPGWRDERRGGFEYVDKEHKPQDLYRGVQAGILFNLYQCYEVLIKENGMPNNIYVSGGILNSGKWTQMCADIFGKEIACANNRDASTVGAAALAMWAAGCLEDVRAFTRDIDGAETIHPDTDSMQVYQADYQRYLACYTK